MYPSIAPRRGPIGLIALLALALALPVGPVAAQPGPNPIGCDAGTSDEVALVLAVRAANAEPDADTIVLSPGCTYSFAAREDEEHASALPLVVAPLTIDGRGATIRRSASGQGPFRLISAAADLTLRDLQLDGGVAPSGQAGGAVLAQPSAALRLEGVVASRSWATNGGAIWAGGTLAIEGSRFWGNNSIKGAGGAVFARGATTVSTSQFFGNSAGTSGGALFVDAGAALVVRGANFHQGAAILGGAIYATGAATIADSGFDNNTARAYGGAIYSLAPLTITHVRLFSNEAASDGEGDQPDGTAAGGAIYAYDTLVIERSQLVRNRADRGAGAIVLVASPSGPSRLVNSLIAQNSAARPGEHVSVCLFCGNAAGTATLAHTTVAAAAGDAQVGLRVGRGAVRVESSILTGFQTAVQRTGDGTLTIRRNLFYANQANHAGVNDAGGHISGQDPLFLDFARGDFRLRPGSPAIDKATPDLVALDLRGVHRPQGGAPDLGAYELDEGALPAGRVYQVACDADALAEAIDAANGDQGADRLVLDEGCAYTIERPAAPGLGLPLVGDYLEIVGNGASIRPAVGAPPMGLLYVRGATLQISDLTLAHAVSDASVLRLDDMDSYGADDDLILSRVTVRDNRMLFSAVSFEGARLLVRGSRFERNQSENEGSAINIASGRAEIDGSLFGSNRAEGRGGAIYADEQLTLRASAFVDNQAKLDGGAIFYDGFDHTIEASTFRANGAGRYGGAIFVYTNEGDPFVIRDSSFAANSAPQGGALYAELANRLELVNNLWHDHPQAASSEAVVVLRPIDAGRMGDVRVVHNSFGAATPAPGAAIRSSGAVTLTLASSIIAGHRAGVGLGEGGKLIPGRNLFWQAPALSPGIAGDPLFVSPAGGDYRLREGSPAIDAADGALVASDMVGTPRPQGRSADMGVYEYVPGATEQPGGSAHRLYLPLLRR